MGIAVLCPSRGNPGALAEALASFNATKMDAGTRFVAVFDANDPVLGEYMEIDDGQKVLVVPDNSLGTMNLALNFAARLWAPQVDVLGFIGDDHRFRTKGWDRVVAKVLADSGGGFAYGNDLYMGDYLPTQVFASSKIVTALGWMGLPQAHHLYLDDTWKYLGDQAGCLYYLPDIIIEHMHPSAGKGAWDANHLRVNAPEVYAHDREIFEAWKRTKADADVAAVRAAIGG